MQTITKFLALLMLSLSVQFISAQDTIQNSNNQYKIEELQKVKDEIKIQEREFLKVEVEAINLRLEKGEITNVEAEKLKKEVAKKRALNIENRIAIVNNKIDLLKRNEDGYHTDDDGELSKIGFNFGGEESSFAGIKIKNKNKPRKYDLRTSSDFVLAFGLNNAIIEGENLDDSPYKFGGSRFFEIGWAWKTRVFKESNFLRLKYGYSFQINGLKPNDNKYFVQQGNETVLQEFPEELKKSKLSITNLVFPVHFEFGPSKRIDKDTYFRYSTDNKFKIGIGGYAGFNIGTRQKLKYELDGERIKDKQKRGFNATNLVYGLSGYIAIDEVALYVKYDLSPIFKDQTIKQNNISIGVRFDMD
ncbi:hypothetical protein SAMN05428642_10166 [Flaviramulus basaltis]|uniref:Outer membrane protein beta-barrel domain-containing protein n=1 Tax=Flaviramulus basaltis TaxID=369401 RepID=A0A1K2IA19_9FLAO|nr:hypothetical protein [Flaviramulus basaltis]SFZ89233.1 hypothetical protein SAMN05428642_10166 [Flaviramulus basaltis]